MVSRGEGRYVIWPVYFDKAVSRLGGRRVSKKYAVEKPSVEDIARAAKSLGLNPVLEKSAFHPSRPFLREGRVLVDKKAAKGKLLVQIASRMK